MADKEIEAHQSKANEEVKKNKKEEEENDDDFDFDDEEECEEEESYEDEEYYEDEEDYEDDSDFEDEEDYEEDSGRAIFKHNEYLSDYLPQLLFAMKSCTRETNLKCIDVGNLGLQTEHMKNVFDLLPNSEVTEFDMEGNDLRTGMSEFLIALQKSNVKKLNLSFCILRTEDVLTLMEALKKTQVTDLDLSFLSSFDIFSPKSIKIFIQHLIMSRVTHLRLTGCSFLGYRFSEHLPLNLPHTTVTHLWLEQTDLGRSDVALMHLLTRLSKTLVTELYLGINEIVDDQLKPLCKSLKKSKLEKLGLHFNKLTDTGMNLLCEALVGSKVRELAVAMNKISGANNLGKVLKDTNITMLHLGCNKIRNLEMFAFPNFLKDTSVTELHLDSCNLGDEVTQTLVKCLKSSEVTKIILSGNNLGLLTASEFANIVNETKIMEVDFSENNFTIEALQVLGEGIKRSKLQRCILRGGLIKSQEGSPVIEFIEKIKNSTLESLDISYTNFENKISVLSSSLKNTTLTYLNLSSCHIKAGIADLALVLKYTAITHLNLSKNELGDAGAIKLAEVLNETKISKLEVKENSISYTGAKALVLCLKLGPLYELDLEQNKVTNQGIVRLSQMMEGTFITNLEIPFNSGYKTIPMTTVMWQNRLLVHRLVSFFKEILPNDGQTFVFNSNLDGMDFITFVDKGLLFYKAIIEEPSAISALVNDEGINFTRDQLKHLASEVFPSQFSSFIGSKTELEVVQHVKFLDFAKALGLIKIVKYFLGNLAALVIEKSENILQPSAYKLLEKYKESICNLELMPENKEKLIQYFSERPGTDFT